MSRRRSNLFILLFVVLLIAVSALVIATKETKLGLDLKGGTELIYQGTPTGEITEVSGSDIERSIEIIRERIDRLGVSEPEVSRIGTDGISVSLPDVTNAQRAEESVGSTAQLYFYDWEPNLLGRETVIGGNPGQKAPDSAVNEANKEWKAAGREVTKAENQQLIFAGAYPNAWGAVKLAEEQKPETGLRKLLDEPDAVLPLLARLEAQADRRPGVHESRPVHHRDRQKTGREQEVRTAQVGRDQRRRDARSSAPCRREPSSSPNSRPTRPGR